MTLEEKAQLQNLENDVADLGYKLYNKTGSGASEIRNASIKNPTSLNVSNAWHVDSSGNMWWGDYATYALATIKISATGVADLDIGSFSGDITGATISSSTITGGTVQTAATGHRVRMNGSNAKLEFLLDDTVSASIVDESIAASGYSGILISNMSGLSGIDIYGQSGSEDAVALFCNNGSNYIKVASDVGGLIGVITNQDILLEELGTGLVIKSPDSTRYRIIVANGGALSTEAY